MARQRGNKWQADVEIDGKRKRPSFNTKEEAEAFETACAAGHNPEHEGTLGSYVDSVFDLLWGEAKSIKNIEGNWRVLYRYIPRNTLLTKIDDLMIEKLTVAMKKDGKANGTVNRKLSNMQYLILVVLF